MRYFGLSAIGFGLVESDHKWDETAADCSFIWWRPITPSIQPSASRDKRIGTINFPSFRHLQNVYFCMLFLADSHHKPGGTTSLYGGDIKFTPKQKENMKKYGTPNGPQTRAASNVDSERWPNAVIPYVFDCSVGKLNNQKYVKLNNKLSSYQLSTFHLNKHCRDKHNPCGMLRSANQAKWWLCSVMSAEKVIYF